MIPYKCGRCGKLYCPDNIFPVYELNCFETHMKICRRCYASFLFWVLGAEEEKMRERKTTREFLKQCGVAEEDLPAEISDLKYGYLREET